MITALGIAYEGTDFAGWQSQASGRGVQNLVEKALAKVAGHAVQTACSGRTDAGVHAVQQIIHCAHCSPRPEGAWLLGANNALPPSVRILWARPMADDFHARFGALSRCYQYVLLNQAGPAALEHRYTAWDFHSLTLSPMREAAQLLLGFHDFSAFRSAECQSHQPERTLLRLDVEQTGKQFVFTVEASGFLHNMVRILVGTLLKVGRGERPPEWILEVLQSKDRTRAGVTAPASGLFFCGARYEKRWGLPDLLYRV